MGVYFLDSRKSMKDAEAGGVLARKIPGATTDIEPGFYIELFFFYNLSKHCTLSSGLVELVISLERMVSLSNGRTQLASFLSNDIRTT